METMEQKTDRNCRVQARYDQLMREGKHGHYETMFRVVREEVERERERCALVCEEAQDQYDNEQIGSISANRIRSGHTPDAPWA